MVGLGIAVVVGLGLEGAGASRALAYFFGGLAMAALGLWLRLTEHEGHAVFWIPIDIMGVAIAIGALVGL